MASSTRVMPLPPEGAESSRDASDDPAPEFRLEDFSKRFDMSEGSLRRLMIAFNLDPYATYAGIMPEQLPTYKKNFGNLHPFLPVPYSDAVKYRTIGFLCGWGEAAQRMTNECTTLGLICSLLSTLLFPVVVNPPSFESVDGALYSPIGFRKV